MESEAFFLKTERLGLRLLDFADNLGEGYSQWLNDPIVCQYNSHHRFPISRQGINDYISDMQDSRSNIVFAIIELDSGKHIGNISLQCINNIDRTAEVAFIIGDTESWGKGYATEAGIAVCRHAFLELNLNRLYLGTTDNNVGMQRVADKLNFKQEGIRREAIYKNGLYHDIIEYGLLKNEL